MNQDKDPIYYLEKAPVRKSIGYMAVPMILGMLVTVIYNLSDAYFIGMLNDTAMLASITLALPFMSLLMGLGTLFGVGGSTYVSRLLGENDGDKARKASSVTFYLALLSGVIVAVVCSLLMPQLVGILGGTGETFSHTYDYVMVLALGSPVIIACFTLGDTIRAEGASRTAMTGMIIGVVMNIALDPLLIFGFGMDVAGAAIALVIANICEMCFYVYYLRRKSKVQSASFSDFKPSKEILTNIFKIGTSSFALCAFLIISTLIFNNYAMQYGDFVVAGFGISMRISQIVESVGMGLAMGSIPIMAYAYGANNKGRLKETISKTSAYLVAVTVIMGAAIYLLRDPLLGLFSADPMLVSLGGSILGIMLLAALFGGMACLFTSIFQAMGKGMESTIMGVIRGAALIPAILIGNAYFGLDGVIWSVLAADIISFTVGCVLWMHARKKVTGPMTEAPLPQ